MTVTINGTTGYSGPVGTIGDLTTTGNTTLGDASSDTLTLNGNTASIPNNLNFTGGNMGLGVAPSAWRSINKVLQIGTVASIANIDATGSSGVDYASNLYFDSGGTARYLITGASASFFRQQSGQFTWYTAGSGTAGNAVSYTQVLTLDANGNLGVGTTSPAQKLHVVQTTDANTDGIRVARSGTPAQYGVLANYGGATWLTAVDTAAGGNNILVFNRSANGSTFTENARFDASGKFLIGGSSSDLSGSTQAMVMGSGGFAVQYTGTTGTYLKVTPGAANGVVDIKSDARSGNYPDLTFSTSATERARITAAGQFLVATTSDTSGMGGQANFVSGNMGIRTFQVGYQVTLNTGIPVNQGSYGGSILLMVSGHTSDQYNTQSALYLIRFPYNGDYTPTKYYITGSSDFVSVGTTGSAGSKTLTLYCDSIPTYTVIMCS